MFIDTQSLCLVTKSLSSWLQGPSLCSWLQGQVGRLTTRLEDTITCAECNTSKRCYKNVFMSHDLCRVHFPERGTVTCAGKVCVGFCRPEGSA